MSNRIMKVLVLALGASAVSVSAQSFRVQCPTSTITHPSSLNNNNAEPAYTGPTTLAAVNGYMQPTANVNGAIKCQQISGGDGYSTMANGVQTFMFSFGPLSGLADIAKGLPGTEFPDVFNTPYPGNLLPGDPATTDAINTGVSPYPFASNTSGGSPATFSWNGAVGVAPDGDCLADPTCAATIPGSGIDGHVDPRQIMDIGVMNGNIPAPLMAMDEDDEFFLTLSNVGMIMRPDLFEQHTVHFHGYPNASSFYDGVPDASVAINIGGSFTYYYLAPDAGTYFWHCHITPPEHLQMGMVGQIYVRPRQNRVPQGNSLYASLQAQQGDLRTACNTKVDILCTNPLPLTNNGVHQGLNKLGNAQMYAYNDGDGVSAYDVEYPLQIHGFDPNFHFVGMTFNPEAFVDMKDKFFLLNGRSYPDTVTPGPLTTMSSDGRSHFSQPLPSIINIPAGGKALLRISMLSVTEYQTLASLGIPMHVVGYNAKLLRDQSGNDLDYFTNSITLGGGESLDVVLDASNTTNYPAGSVFYLYTPQLDHLANDQENFGGLMTEVHIN
jgi:FtsP/CotA-like multicopper oxidase with cupredoxin domain